MLCKDVVVIIKLVKIYTHMYYAYLSHGPWRQKVVYLRFAIKFINYTCILPYRYFFMEFASHEQAVAAVNAGNGYRLDKSHIFSVYFFTDFEK